MVGGPIGAAAMAAYMVVEEGFPVWWIPLIVLASIPLGYIAGVAYYNRTLFMRRLFGRDAPKK
jgi:hypothetical protein